MEIKEMMIKSKNGNAPKEFKDYLKNKFGVKETLKILSNIILYDEKFDEIYQKIKED